MRPPLEKKLSIVQLIFASHVTCPKKGVADKDRITVWLIELIKYIIFCLLLVSSSINCNKLIYLNVSCGFFSTFSEQNVNYWQVKFHWNLKVSLIYFSKILFQVIFYIELNLHYILLILPIMELKKPLDSHNLILTYFIFLNFKQNNFKVNFNICKTVKLIAKLESCVTQYEEHR